MSEDQLVPFAGPEALSLAPQDQLIYATGLIRGYCKWHIYPSITETMTLDTRGGRLLVLPTLMLTDVVSINLTETGTVLDPACYRKSRRGMIELRRGHHHGCPHPGHYHDWPVGFEAVTVTFTHGYSDLPAELLPVVASIGARMPTQMRAVDREIVFDTGARFHGGVLAGGFSPASGFTVVETTVLDDFRIKDRG